MASPEHPELNSDAETGDISARLYRSLEQEVVSRGDRQLPDEPNRGFEIKRLTSERLSHPVAPVTALPISYQLRGGDAAAARLMAEDLDHRIQGGSVSLVQVPESRAGYEKFQIEYPVHESAYLAAVAAGTVADGLFGPDNKANGYNSQTEPLAALADRQDHGAALDAGTANSHRLSLLYRDDLQDLKQFERDELQTLSEAYELSDGGRAIRLLNFSHTRLTDEQLRQATNVVRSLADKSGGGIFDRLSTITVLPEDHSSMWADVKIDGEPRKLPRNGFQSGSLLALSEWIIQPPGSRSQRPDYQAGFFEQYRLPGEPIDGPDAPKRSVSGGQWELVLAHELEHIALPRSVQSTTPLEGAAPTLYGRKDKLEHVAELGAAEYAGGPDALAIPRDQRHAKQAMWQQYRGSKDNGISYQQPLGPHYVTCQELDLSAGPLPPILKDPTKPIEVNIVYRLLPNQKA